MRSIIKQAATLSVYQFFKKFPDEASAVTFLENELWKDGAKCPHCGSTNNFPRPLRNGHRCKNKECRKDFTVRMGTVFECSRMPLNKWLYAIYTFQTSRKGVSSLQLSKELGITQKSAWYLLQRLREACNSDTTKLCGIVEIDETYIGGKEKNKHANKEASVWSRGVGKQAVLGMRERGGKVKAMLVPDTGMSILHKKIGSAVEFGSTVYTDEHRSYKRLHTAYKHGSVCHSAKEYVNGMMAHTNGIESVWAVLKRGYNGVYHNFSKKHLHRYVNEFTFRLNEGNCEIDTVDRIKSLVRGAGGRRISYKDLVA